MLDNLLNQLNGYDYAIWDDNSDFKQLDNMYRFSYNHGKKQAYKKFNKIFEINRKLYSNYEYYFVLPDDVELCEDFVEEAIELWDNIQDDKKICLSFASEERKIKSCFTAEEPIIMGDVILTQWTDMLFMCGKEFMNNVLVEDIDPNRWDKNPNLSSGVGSSISHQLHKKGYNMYHATEEMAVHIGNDCSLMNKNERQINKL